jgi:hypothetical protein
MRPRPVTIAAWLLILVGGVTLAEGLRPMIGGVPLASDDGHAALVRGLGVVAGAGLLAGQNWARWLAAAWWAFHVAISAGGSASTLFVHGAIFGAYLYVLFRPESAAYFGRPAGPAGSRPAR